jgi:hypothetical protein
MTFSLGEIVVSDFSGMSRQMYTMGNQGPQKSKQENDNLLNIKDVGIVVDIYNEGAMGFTWIKLLTSTGSIGYIPSIWVKKI